MISKNKINYDLERLIKNNTSKYQFTPIFETIDSTNTYIKNNFNTLLDKTIILSKHQTNGRGRFDRNFLSNNEKGIYCSFLIKKNINENLLKFLNLKLACALHDAIKSSFNIDTQIKWPNDIIINQKKVAGILIEAQIESNNYKALIIGFGLNIYHQEFDQTIKNIATSLEDHFTNDYDRNLLLTHFFNQLDFFLYHPNILTIFKKYMLPIGTKVNMTINMNKEIVEIIDINTEGQLIVQTMNNKKITLFNEEIYI